MRDAGRAALVTGGARGIGLAVAQRLDQRGHQLALFDRDDRALASARGRFGERHPFTVTVDITDVDALQAAVAGTVQHLGSLDLVFANAGIPAPFGTLRGTSNETFSRVIEVNLLGTWRTIHAVLPHLVASRGHLVLVASIGAFLNGTLSAPYFATKAAIEQLGRALRVELTPHGVNVSIVYPGIIDTDLAEAAFADPLASKFEDMFPGFMSRRMKVDDAAEAIVKGIERKSPRIFVPRGWQALSMVRGLGGVVFDRAMVKNKRLTDLVREADVREADVRDAAESPPIDIGRAT